jgi:hypothetical protein
VRQLLNFLIYNLKQIIKNFALNTYIHTYIHTYGRTANSNNTHLLRLFAKFAARFHRRGIQVVVIEDRRNIITFEESFQQLSIAILLTRLH